MNSSFLEDSASLEKEPTDKPTDLSSASGDTLMSPIKEHDFTFDVEEVGSQNPYLIDFDFYQNTGTTLQPENLINASRLNSLKKYFTRDLISLILEEDFEYGFDTKADILVRKQMELNSMATKEWLNSLFVESFANTALVMGILRIIAQFDYLTILPVGPTMALAALSHRSSEVQECATRAFENWGTADSLEILKSLDVSASWLQEYINDVIEDLESERYGNTSKKNK